MLFTYTIAGPAERESGEVATPLVPLAQQDLWTPWSLFLMVPSPGRMSCPIAAFWSAVRGQGRALGGRQACSSTVCKNEISQEARGDANFSTKCPVLARFDEPER